MVFVDVVPNFQGAKNEKKFQNSPVFFPQESSPHCIRPRSEAIVSTPASEDRCCARFAATFCRKDYPKDLRSAGSPKYIPRKSNMEPENPILGKEKTFSKLVFFGFMLVFGWVYLKLKGC